jgi:proteasome accessory factor B
MGKAEWNRPEVRDLGDSKDMRPPPAVRNYRIESELESEPHSPSIRLPLARLLQLLMLLQSERFPNARRLAEACAVSRRTIYRDLTTLETAGLSVLYIPDRQGYQLARDCVLPPTQLDDREALALLLMTRLGVAQDPFGLLLAARNAVAKVVQALPGEKRRWIANLSELLADDPMTALLPSDRQPIYESILRALSERKRLRLWYRDREKSATATTTLSLYRLARFQRHWSVVGHSSAHGEVRIYAVPWIQRAELTDESYSIPPRFRLDRFLRKLGSNDSAPLQQVRLRFTPEVAPDVRDSPRPSGQVLSAGAGGGLDLSLEVDSLDEILPWVITFGDQVEVLQPEQLRIALRGWAEKIARIHSSGP